MGKKASMADTLREAISSSGLSANAVAKAIGVRQATVIAIVRGGNFRLSTASKMAALLGLELQKKQQPQP